MRVTFVILGIVALMLTNCSAKAEPLKVTINRSGTAGQLTAAAPPSPTKSPKRDSSDQTAVEDKTGQSQNYQNQPQIQSGFLPLNQQQYYAQAAASPQVHYAKPEIGGVEYAKPEIGGVEYAATGASNQYRSSSASAAGTYQTIGYSAHHPGHNSAASAKLISGPGGISGGIQYAVPHQQHQQQQQQIQYYAAPAPNHQHQALQYAAYAVPASHQHFSYAAAPNYAYAAYPTGHGAAGAAGYSNHHQQPIHFAFAPASVALPAQLATNQHQHQIVRGGGIQYASIVPSAQHYPQYAIFSAAPPTISASAAPVHSSNYLKYQPTTANTATHQQPIIYANHPAALSQYYAAPTPGYYHQQPTYQYIQPAAYQPIHPNYATIQYSAKHLHAAQPQPQSSATGSAGHLGSVTPVVPVQSVHYKNYISAAAAASPSLVGSHNGGASSFSTYSAQLPASSHLTASNGNVQVIKVAATTPIVYATTSAPSGLISGYQQHHGHSLGRIYYAATPPQSAASGHGYTHSGAIHYGTHLYHPTGGKAAIISSPAAPSAAATKY